MSILQPPPEQTVAPRKRVMRIVSGLHTGASRPVAEQETLLIGSGDDCDVVLADAGVARHHALVALSGDDFTIRALDAPLNAGDRPLYPGDPIALQPLQRIGLGEAALAVGFDSDPGWAGLAPTRITSGGTPVMPQLDGPARTSSRRWPLIGALGALSLASVAIFAAVVPARMAVPPPEARLGAIARDFQVVDAEIVNQNDTVVLSGTVRDGATRQALSKRVLDEGLDAQLDLRTGEDMANDVRDVLRGSGLVAKTRYLGEGKVEVSGNFDDKQLTEAATSRAMQEVKGVRFIVPNNTSPNASSSGAAAASAAQAARSQRRMRAQVVEIVRGPPRAYVETADGKRYEAGAEIPGWGTLTSIGSSAWVIDANGNASKLQVQPRASFVDVVVGNGVDMNTNASGVDSAQPPHSELLPNSPQSATVKQ